MVRRVLVIGMALVRGGEEGVSHGVGKGGEEDVCHGVGRGWVGGCWSCD